MGPPSKKVLPLESGQPGPTRLSIPPINRNVDRTSGAARLPTGILPKLPIPKIKSGGNIRMGDSTLIASAGKLTRQQLAAVSTPLGTATHRPIPHAEVVGVLVET